MEISEEDYKVDSGEALIRERNDGRELLRLEEMHESL